MSDEHSIRDHPGKTELETVFSEIRSDIEAIEENRVLYNEKNFSSRADAVDDLEFHITERIDGLLRNKLQRQELTGLKRRAEKVKLQLEEINADLFRRLRRKIQLGKCRGTAFRDMIGEFAGGNLKESASTTIIGYDNLDVFVDGLFPIETFPDETREREPEMVFYQKTPARIVFELANKTHFNKKDVFYDIGSGLGQVAILVNLLRGVTAKGVEFEPAYCNFATAAAAELNLPGVQFINIDARQADYSDGTVFFMYTPFVGRTLEEVLDKLRLESLDRNIRILTYGPCTLEVARQSWLNQDGLGEDDIYKLSVFYSL